MADEIAFPVNHDKCPVCGSTKRLGQQAVDRLKKDGALPQAFPYVGITLQARLMDPLHPPVILATNFTIPVIVISFDACANPECGAVYCTRFNIVNMPAQVGSPRQQPPPHYGPNGAQRRHAN